MVLWSSPGLLRRCQSSTARGLYSELYSCRWYGDDESETFDRGSTYADMCVCPHVGRRSFLTTLWLTCAFWYSGCSEHRGPWPLDSIYSVRSTRLLASVISLNPCTWALYHWSNNDPYPNVGPILSMCPRFCVDVTSTYFCGSLYTIPYWSFHRPDFCLGLCYGFGMGLSRESRQHTYVLVSSPFVLYIAGHIFIPKIDTFGVSTLGVCPLKSHLGLFLARSVRC